jgi:uncharacterized protein
VAFSTLRASPASSSHRAIYTIIRARPIKRTIKRRRQRYSKAEFWVETTKTLERRAQHGNTDALFRLGFRRAFGRNRPRPTDWSAVVPLWKQAAEAGHARAQFYLGVCYDEGNGVENDLVEAMRWYRQAAESGHRVAQYNIALGYRKGEGVPVDKEATVYWLTRAAEAGYAEAQRDLGYCYHEGDGISIDFIAAAHWYRKAAKSGDAIACYNLYLSYHDGDGVKASERWSQYWLQKAAAYGHRKAKRIVSRRTV